MIQPTLREVKELAKQIVAEHTNGDYNIALKEAKEKLIPTIIKAIVAELPESIEHEPGDNFYPDTFCNKGSKEKFARGKLDENSHYHLYMRHNPDNSKILHYDLCLEDDLQRLISDILWASQIGKMHEATASEINMKLFDHADGCRDHYCVGRYKYYPDQNVPYAEFWNEKQQRFCSAGTVYIGKDAANEVLKKLNNEQML